MAILEAQTSVGDIVTADAGAAKVVSLATSSFIWNGDTDVPTTITFSGTAQNLSANMTLRVRGLTDGQTGSDGTFLDITADAGSTQVNATTVSSAGTNVNVAADFSISVAETGSFIRLIAELTTTGTDNNIGDTVTVIRLGSDGESTYNIILANEAHVIPSANDRSSPILTGSGTNILAFYGTTQLDFVETSTPGIGEFTVSVGSPSDTNMTAGALASDPGLFATLEDLTAWGGVADISSLPITATMRGAATEASTSFSKIQSFTRSRAGADPITGFLSNEAETVAANNAGDAGTFSVGGTFRVFDGNNEITTESSVTFAVTATADFGGEAIVDATGVYEVTSFTDNTTATTNGSVEFTATIGTLVISKQFSITKSLAGGIGDDANLLTLSTDRQSFEFANSNDATTTTGTSTLTAALTGFDSNTALTEWTASTFTTTGTEVDISADTTRFEPATATGLTATLKALAFGANSDNIARVVVTASKTENSVAVSDTLTSYKVREGDTVSLDGTTPGQVTLSTTGNDSDVVVMDGATGQTGDTGVQGGRGPGRFFLEVNLSDATAPEVGPTPYETDTDFRDNAVAAIESALGTGETPIKDDVVTIQYNTNAAPNTTLNGTQNAGTRTTFTVQADGTLGFPDKGSLLIGAGATQEVFTYTSRSTSQFLGESQTFLEDHADSEAVVLNGTTVIRNAVHDGTSDTNPIAWDKFGLEIDGSLLVNGTVVSDSIATGAVNASKVSVDGSIRIRDTLGSISGGLDDVSWDTDNASTSVLSDNASAASYPDIGDGFFLGNAEEGGQPVSRFFVGDNTAHLKWDGSTVETRGLNIRDDSGDLVFSSGGGLSAAGKTVSGFGSLADLNSVAYGDVSGTKPPEIIGSNAVLSTYITGAFIDTAQIADLAIQNAQIGTAEVGTLKIQGEAVTVSQATIGSINSSDLSITIANTVPVPTTYQAIGFCSVSGGTRNASGWALIGQGSTSNAQLSLPGGGTDVSLLSGGTVEIATNTSLGQDSQGRPLGSFGTGNSSVVVSGIFTLAANTGGTVTLGVTNSLTNGGAVDGSLTVLGVKR